MYLNTHIFPNNGHSKNRMEVILMEEKIKKECVVHFLNLPPKEQLEFVFDQAFETYLKEQYEKKFNKLNE